MNVANPDPPISLTVAAVVERDRMFLLVEERIAGRLVLNQPAGHVENGETLWVAVIRETLEETAFTFVPEAILGVYLWGRGAGGPRFLRVAFCGRLRSPMVLRSVEDFLSGIRQPIDRCKAMTRDPLLLQAPTL